MPTRIPFEIVPLLIIAYLLVGLIITFSIAYGLGHIDRTVVPYISQTGICTPENGIFTIVMFGTSLLVLITLVVKFKQISDNTEIKHKKELIIHITNLFAFLFGIISVIGALLIGAYRMNDAPKIHDTSVNISIGSSVLYYTLQTAISPFIKPKLKIRWLLFAIRVVIILLIITLISLYTKDFDNQNVSGSIEWALVTVVNSYFLTFVPEFRKLNVKLHVEIRKQVVGVELNKERVWYDGEILSKDETLRIKLLEN